MSEVVGNKLSFVAYNVVSLFALCDLCTNEGCMFSFVAVVTTIYFALQVV